MEITRIDAHDRTGILASASASYNAKKRMEKKDEPEKYQHIVHAPSEPKGSSDRPYDEHIVVAQTYKRNGELIFEKSLGGIVNELA